MTSVGLILIFFQVKLQDKFCQESFFLVQKLSVSNSNSSLVTKLEVHSCKNEVFNEFLPSYKTTSLDNLLRFLDILIGKASFRQLITQL